MSLGASDEDLRHSYKGIITREPRKPSTDQQVRMVESLEELTFFFKDRTWEASKSFTEITYWNLETAPSSGDCFRKVHYAGLVVSVSATSLSPPAPPHVLLALYMLSARHVLTALHVLTAP